ncbi:hypothetical protein WOB87_22715 [Vibrio parahaemolyticus]|nr:hypothetical protein [Vibrio parahaemolyticus]EGR1226411.1 hypothetical protein [Vibrio parahaemolyticus]EJG0658133.1 hypothetical protein [Vibrio parahaemolyticus]
MQNITFPRNVNNVFAQADEHGVLVNCGWSVGILPSDAVDYVNTYNSNPNRGFFEVQGKGGTTNVVLSHNGGKITFSKEEANALIALIRAAYP